MSIIRGITTFIGASHISNSIAGDPRGTKSALPTFNARGTFEVVVETI